MKLTFNLPRRGLNAYLLLALLLQSMGMPSVEAKTLSLTQAPSSSLGLWSQWLIEDTHELSLTEAQAYRAEGRFEPSKNSTPSFGIGGRPVWLYLRVNNAQSTPLARQLLVGMSWIDQVDIYLLPSHGEPVHWRAGDGLPGQQRAEPDRGFSFSYDFPPGTSELYVRAATLDVMALPLYLLTPEHALADSIRVQYVSGFFYGYLLALFIYNLLLFAGLRQRRYLDYSVYLACFILLTAAHTGLGLAWLWPDALHLQSYVIFLFMILFFYSGLRFAEHFLQLSKYAPRLARSITWLCRLCLTSFLLAVIFRQQMAVTVITYGFALFYIVAMIAYGLITVQHRKVAGRYYLLAVLCGALGITITVLAMLGILPVSSLTYHASELGVMIEATLLALALVYQMRQDQRARKQAENLARIDPLTGLLNRRAFLEQGEALWSNARRNQRPLTVIMLDLDFFKQINDRLGHAAGDTALVKTAHLLTQACRRSDLAARWGGEEFILLLPEASLEQAVSMAERLREQIAELSLPSGNQRLPLHASFGVVAYTQQVSLEALIAEADHWLYAAKQGGRNQVMAPH